MAPKVKIESLANDLDQVSKRTMPKRPLDDDQQDQAASQQSATKRVKAPLNFSIESIMQSSQQQVNHNNNNSTFRQSFASDKNVSRSPSPSSDAGSSRSSRSSGAESRASTLGSRISENGAQDDNCFQVQKNQTQHNNLHLNLNLNNLVDNHNESFASSGSSNSSSRISSPISPGCNSTTGAVPTNEQLLQLATAKVNKTLLRPSSPGDQQQMNGQIQREQQQLNNNINSQPAANHHHHHHQAGTSSGPKSLSSSSSKSHRSGHHSTNSRIKPVCTDSRLAPFECHLDNLDLWHRFHPLDTEMIITKQGRRMFPPVRVTFSFNEQLLHHQQQAASCNQQQQQPQLQFNSRDRYQVLMDILPYDNKRYRYAYHKSSWQQAGKADPPSPTKLFLHPDGPFTLDQLKRQVISFEKIKLTNNDGNKHGYIVLNSMHKYQPRIHLILWRGKESQSLANAPVNLLDQEAHKTFIFSETIFTAVTAYQNHSITKLKIDSNPFAKGFRDSTRLTDLELESMQDLIAEGQCPFSPPRAPPPGFPHYLFAAAAQQQQQQFNGSLHQQHQQPFGSHPGQHQFGSPGGIQMAPSSKHPGEDATAALLRERTIMALDSFLQQQQQQQQQQQSSSESPHQMSAGKPPGGLNTMSPSQRSEQLQSSSPNTGNNNVQSAIGPPLVPTSNHSFNPAAHFANAFLVSNGPPSSGPPPPPMTMTGPPLSTGPNAGQPTQNQIEQFIMQQQQHFAAAMAAAAASGLHQHPAYLQSLLVQAAGSAAAQQQCQLPPPVGSTTPTSQAANIKLGSSTSPPSAGGRQMTQPAIITSGQQQHVEQTSPIGLAKSANRLQLDLNQFLGHPITSSAGGGVPPPQPPPPSSQQHQIHQQHIQAIMQQQHQMQQMAALAHHQQQQQHHHLSHHHNIQQQQQAQACLQMEPLIALQESGVGSRRTTKNK